MKIINKPRVTEKSSMLAEANIYSFNVAKSTTKSEIKKAIFELYKVKPVKVNTISFAGKKITVRGKKGVKAGGKKAFVYLKKGDKIEVI
ncbi:MAG: 50S ribosomal protein L23 [Patescibacteria group bacterium]